MYRTGYIIVLLSCSISADGLIKGSIPAHLLDCYQEPRPPLLPLTIHNLIEVIRKINDKSFTPVTLAQQAADILHWFSVDGLERNPNVTSRQPGVVPYHRTGFQAYKQLLFFETLMPLKSRSFDNSWLTLSEKCTLHLMVSSSIDAWERGDEARVCPNNHEEFVGGGARLSSCPLEGGAVQISDKAVNMGTVLKGIAAALTPQVVQLDQLIPSQVYQPTSSQVTVSNLWAATLAGDLAEIAVLQSPEYKMDTIIGMSERWNDTFIPTQLYLSNIPYKVLKNQSWQMTNAEILGGIDGLLIGSKAAAEKTWTSRMRLSQLLDLYYLDSRMRHGFHQCKQEAAFNTFIYDKRHTLTTQTQNFALLLSTKTTSYFLDKAILEGRCLKIVDKFLRYYHEIFGQENCPPPGASSARLNIFMILDATWTSYTALQFIIALAQMVDVSYYGSTISIVNGDSSQIRVTPTSSQVSLYQQMKQNIPDPTGLNLQKPFLRLKRSMEESNQNESILSRPRQAQQDVVLVLGHSSTVSDKELDLSKDIVYSIKMQNPAVRFVYWTSHVNAPRFVQLTSVPGSQLDSLVPTGDSALQAVLPRIHSALNSGQARSLKPAYCRNDSHQWPESWYQEFATPEKTNNYWIHPKYLCNSLDIVKITFRNHDYGDLVVCMSRDEEQLGDCKDVKRGTEVTHGLTRPCDTQEQMPPLHWHPNCRPVYFTVQAIHSADMCTDYECRYLDQVKFDIIVQDLHCIDLNAAVCSAVSDVISYFYLNIVFVLLTIVIININDCKDYLV